MNWVTRVSRLFSDYKLGYKIYYWRTAANTEVDFVLYGDKGIRAFEIKRTTRAFGGILKGLKCFLGDYPISNVYFIYGGNREMRDGKISILPVENALRRLPELLS